MATVIADKYHLKSIHEEIGLFDRKLAHLLKFEKFETDGERDEAARKLNLKRSTLVKTATRLAAEGVEFKRGDLPRSMRPDDEPDVETPVPEKVAAEPLRSQVQKSQSSVPYAGTSLDWQASVRQYLQKKGKSLA